MSAIRCTRYSSEPILKPQPGTFYSRAIYNPTVWQDETGIVLLFRAEQDDDCTGRIGLARSADGVHFAIHPEPILIPEYSYEVAGCEDPRLIHCADQYIMTYVGKGSDRHRLCLASGTDLFHWQKHGEVLQPLKNRWDGRQVKAGAVFSEVVANRYAMCYLGEQTPWQTAIGLAWSDDLLHWYASSDTPILLPRPGYFDSMGVEPGPSLIPLGEGWLLIYNGWNTDKVHCVGAALLDRHWPMDVIARLDEPLLAPELLWEVAGWIPHVAFAEGTAQFGDTLYLYYGAADQCIGLATIKLSDLMAAILDTQADANGQCVSGL